MKYKESALAHKYLDGLIGIEIGGSAHNPFNIKGCKNVDYTDDMNTVFKQAEYDWCREKAKVDIVADGDKLPFENDSLDYVLSSHVLEHFSDPIRALKEWDRVTRKGGYIFMIIPHKEMTFDKKRERTTLKELIDRHETGNYPKAENGHSSVWVTEDVVELCGYMGMNVIESHDIDDKVGNGFTIVVQK